MQFLSHAIFIVEISFADKRENLQKITSKCKKKLKNIQVLNVKACANTANIKYFSKMRNMLIFMLAP